VAGSEIPVTVIRGARAEDPGSTPPQLLLESSSSIAGDGKSQRFGEEIGVALSGTRSRTHRLSATGQLLSAEGRDSLAISFDLPSVGQTVPATQRGHLSIHRIQGSR